MTLSQSYKNALIGALAFHFIIALMLIMDPSSNKPPVLEMVKNPDPMQSIASAQPAQQEPIKAVNVDEREIQKTMNQLKQQQLQKLQAEQARQRNLQKQAELARKARMEEQKHLQTLKEEAQKIAIAHKKQLEEEKKRIAEMKQQQQQEAKKLAELKKQQNVAKLKAEAEAKRKKETLEKAAQQAALERKKQEATRQAAQEAMKNARIAGEVDRYKALIINAISRQWILPENAKTNLSSQFRIRLAPDGSVLEVSLTRSSGDSVLDHSAQSAIYKASPLPVPNDPAAFNVFRDISLTVRPENARG